MTRQDDADAMACDTQMIAEKVQQLLDSHQNTPWVEMEFRLGRFTANGFETDVGKSTFYAIHNGLEQYKEWEEVRRTLEDVYYNDENRIRLSVGQDGLQAMVQKDKLAQIDFKEFKNAPLDLRFSVSREMPVQGQYEMDRKRTKQRTRYVRKGLAIDLTVMQGDQVDMDAEDPCTYHVELEILRPDVPMTIEECFNMCHKVNDVLAIIGTDSAEPAPANSEDA